MTLDPAQLAEQGRRAFNEKKFEQAAELFQQAAQGFTLGRAGLSAAEMDNNRSVALLQAGKPQDALEAVLGTDEYFAAAKDRNRQAMALGNQAAALEALGRSAEALEKYEHAAELFGEIDDGDMRALVMRSAATIKLKSGKVAESAFKMMGALEARQKPSIFERILRFFLRFSK